MPKNIYESGEDDLETILILEERTKYVLSGGIAAELGFSKPSFSRAMCILKENGYINDFSNTRLHHEIYLSDARRVAPEKLKTVIRHPIRKKDNL